MKKLDTIISRIINEDNIINIEKKPITATKESQQIIDNMDEWIYSLSKRMAGKEGSELMEIDIESARNIIENLDKIKKDLKKIASKSGNDLTFID